MLALCLNSIPLYWIILQYFMQDKIISQVSSQSAIPITQITDSTLISCCIYSLFESIYILLNVEGKATGH